jgi:hypothetical protein
VSVDVYVSGHWWIVLFPAVLMSFSFLPFNTFDLFTFSSGRIMSFYSHISGLNDKVSGQWFTTNESVISVDALSGVAKAIGEGSAQGAK